MSILSLIITYRLVQYCILSHTDVYLVLSLWGVISFGTTYAAALLIVWIILKPIDQFVRRAEKLPAVQTRAPDKRSPSVDQLDRYATVFTRVADALSKVDALEHFPGVVGQSRLMRAVLGQILKVSPADATVLVTGESGTGKEVAAGCIHEHSLRKDKPFIAVNCAAIPDGLLESELFGHEKGAFTGATALKKGKFELADKGTLFLDEIGDMPLETQAKILRALEGGFCERVGGANPIRVDVRLIAATNKNLEKMIEGGSFREDLYHRLNVFRIHLPPLRERREDIPLLATHFIERFNKDLTLSPEALQVLVASAWPGNVRELRNAMERAAVLAEDGIVHPRDIPLPALGALDICRQPSPSVSEPEGGVANGEEEAAASLGLDERLHELEKSLILAALSQAGGVQIRAAELLGIKERSLWHRIKKYDIDVSALKS